MPPVASCTWYKDVWARLPTHVSHKEAKQIQRKFFHAKAFDLKDLNGLEEAANSVSVPNRLLRTLARSWSCSSCKTYARHGDKAVLVPLLSLCSVAWIGLDVKTLGLRLPEGGPSLLLSAKLIVLTWMVHAHAHKQLILT